MSYAEKDLSDLAKLALGNKYEYVNNPQKIRGKSGKYWKFDAIIKDYEAGKFGIFIRDWKREISITQLRQLHKACLDTKFVGGIMICNIVTDFSQDYCQQFGIQLLSRGRLVSMLKKRDYEF